jgi:MinD-like ATPase involved in chromosome partitioning or flagellar assembly
VVVIDAHMRGLDREVVAELASSHVRCIALTDSDADMDRLAAIGATVLFRDDVTGLVDVVRDAPTSEAASYVNHPAADVAPSGRIIAVWGPTGAPGRTSVAIELAARLSRAHDTMLVDADTVGPSVAQHLGLIDDTSGLAAAVRAATRGSLDPPGLAAAAVAVPGGFRVLVGLPSADRWTELRPASVGAMLRCSRSTVTWTVVDVGFGIEGNDLDWVDPGTPVRYGAARSVLAEADVVVCVGRPDPVGVVRLVKGFRDVRDLAPTAVMLPVVNVTHPEAGGVEAAELVAAELEVPDVLVLPNDPKALRSAMARGMTVAEAHQRSAFTEAIDVLGGHVVECSGFYDEPHARDAGTHRRLLRRPHRRHRRRDARVV